MKSILPVVLASATFCAHAVTPPKNVIMVVGDGMGPAYTTAYRYFADDVSTKEVETTVYDRLLVGMASTYPAPVSGYVTDSAAGATALSSGVKTYNGAIGVDVDKKPVQTVLEWAKHKGLKTGVAVTSQINHATPAGYAAHNESRKNYNQIADSYFDDRTDGNFTADVMLGGGQQYFQREDRDLVSEFKQAGYQYVDAMDALGNLVPGKPALGLLAPVGMPWALDMPGQQRLPQITQAAVKQLENDKGFFLLVEASQVDWGGHANDIGAAMGEMHDMAVTLEWLEAYINAHPDTLMVVTADHSTGGMTIAKGGKYEWQPHWLNNLKASPESIAKTLSQSKQLAQDAEQLFGFSLTTEEINALLALAGQDQKAWYTGVKHLLDERTHTGWTTGGHTGIDVQVFAKGPGSEQFAGHLDNTDIAKTLFHLLGKK